MRQKKIQILYGNVGSGHKSIAEAVGTQIDALGHNVEYTEGLSTWWFDPNLIFDFVSDKGKTPFQTAYNLTNSRFGIKLSKLFLLAFKDHIRNIIQESNPDIIVSCHPFISPSALDESMQFKKPWVHIVSNITPHLLELAQEASINCVPTKEVYEFAKRIIPEDKLFLSGFPVSEGFKEQNPPNSNQILLMGGGSGQGKLKEQTLALSSGLPNHKIVVVCGKNKVLKKTISALNLPNVVVLAYSRSIPELMADSDIVVTKAGPNTIFEAITTGRPVITTGINGPQEAKNPEFICSNKFGLHCPDPKLLPQAVAKIYDSYESFRHPSSIPADSAKKIAEKILSF